ncbi:MAG: hypothetical protein ACLRWQ_14050 [Flavonifractor plautii]
MREGKPVDFTFQPILQYGPDAAAASPMASFSAMLDRVLRAAGKRPSGCTSGAGPDQAR